MIYQNDTFENTENLFANAVKDLQFGRLLHKSNVRKSCGIPVLVGANDATTVLKDGQVVTLDTPGSIVYDGNINL